MRPGNLDSVVLLLPFLLNYLNVFSTAQKKWDRPRSADFQ
jgi:hypothetical protein